MIVRRAEPATASQQSPSFELRFRPNVRLIALVRSFVSDFYAGVVADPDTASRLALATHELLENAVKYSVDGETDLHVEVDVKDGTVCVRARNRASSERIAALSAAFEEIDAAPDATTHYERLVRRTATSTSGSGGLGLARIWAECDLALRLRVAGDEIEIQARGRVITDGP